MDNWTLTEDQLRFMVIWYPSLRNIDNTFFKEFVDIIDNSDAYKQLFGDMPWDEAYDRFDCWLDGEENISND
jgi:GTP1/Obg family GTP-binding protein